MVSGSPVRPSYRSTFTRTDGQDRVLVAKAQRLAKSDVVRRALQGADKLIRPAPLGTAVQEDCRRLFWTLMSG